MSSGEHKKRNRRKLKKESTTAAASTVANTASFPNVVDDKVVLVGPASLTLASNDSILDSLELDAEKIINSSRLANLETISKIEQMMDSGEDPLPKLDISQGANPYFSRQKCLICQRDQVFMSTIQTVTGDGCDDIGVLTGCDITINQLHVWVCADCRRAEIERKQGTGVSQNLASEIRMSPVTFESVSADLSTQAAGRTSPTDIAASGRVCPCQACLERRELEREQEKEALQLHSCWSKIHKAVRRIYHDDGIGCGSPEDSGDDAGVSGEKLKEIVHRLCVRNPHQLFLWLESQGRELVMEMKTSLLKNLGLGIRSPAQAQAIIGAMLDHYSKLCAACKRLHPIVKELQEHLQKLNMNWELVNRHLFQSLVYADHRIQNALPELITQLRSPVDDDREQSAMTSLLLRYVKFDHQMTVVSVMWREVEPLVQEFNMEQATLKAKKRKLREDWELFRMQRKILELKKSNSTATRCSCEECTLKYIFSCGFLPHPPSSLNLDTDLGLVLNDAVVDGCPAVTKGFVLSSPVGALDPMVTANFAFPLNARSANSSDPLANIGLHIGGADERLSKWSCSTSLELGDTSGLAAFLSSTAAGVPNNTATACLFGGAHDDDDSAVASDDNDGSGGNDGSAAEEDDGIGCGGAGDSIGTNGKQQQQQPCGNCVLGCRCPLCSRAAAVSSAPAVVTIPALSSSPPVLSSVASSPAAPATDKQQPPPAECECHVCVHHADRATIPAVVCAPPRPAALHLYPHIHGSNTGGTGSAGLAAQLPPPPHLFKPLLHSQLAGYGVAGYATPPPSPLNPRSSATAGGKQQSTTQESETPALVVVPPLLSGANGSAALLPPDGSMLHHHHHHHLNNTAESHHLTNSGASGSAALPPPDGSMLHHHHHHHLYNAADTLDGAAACAAMLSETGCRAPVLENFDPVDVDMSFLTNYPWPELATVDSRLPAPADWCPVVAAAAASSSIAIGGSAKPTAGSATASTSTKATQASGVPANAASGRHLLEFHGAKQPQQQQHTHNGTPVSAGGSAGAAGWHELDAGHSHHHHHHHHHHGGDSSACVAGAGAVGGGQTSSKRSAAPPVHTCGGGGSGGPGSHLPSHLGPAANKHSCISDSCLCLPEASLSSGSSCPNQDTDSYSGDPEESLDDTCSEQSSSTSTSNQKDNKHCDCCYCEVFGHDVAALPPMSRNFTEMRDKLRMRLSKKKMDCKNSINSNSSASSNVTGSVQKEPLEDRRDIDSLINFINGTKKERSEAAAAAAAAKLNSVSLVKLGKKSTKKPKKADVKPSSSSSSSKGNSDKGYSSDTTCCQKKSFYWEATTAVAAARRHERRGSPKITSGRETATSLAATTSSSAEAGAAKTTVACSHVPPAPVVRKVVPPVVVPTIPDHVPALVKVAPPASQAKSKSEPLPTTQQQQQSSQKPYTAVESTQTKASRVNKTVAAAAAVADRGAASNAPVQSNHTTPAPQVRTASDNRSSSAAKTNSAISSAPTPTPRAQAVQPNSVVKSATPATSLSSSPVMPSPAKTAPPNSSASPSPVTSSSTSSSSTLKKKRKASQQPPTSIASSTSSTVAVNQSSSSSCNGEHQRPATAAQLSVGAAHNKRNTPSPRTAVVTTVVDGGGSSSGGAEHRSEKQRVLAGRQQQQQQQQNVTSVTLAAINVHRATNGSSPAAEMNGAPKRLPLLSNNKSTGGGVAEKIGTVAHTNGVSTNEPRPTVVAAPSPTKLKSRVIANSSLAISESNRAPAKASSSAENVRIAYHNSGHSGGLVTTGTRENNSLSGPRVIINGRSKHGQKQSTTSNNTEHAIDDIFVPRDIDLDNGELDEMDREVEAFKRFCWNSVPLANKEKVHVNLKDIVIRKKTMLGCS